MPRDLLKVKDKNGSYVYLLVGGTIAKVGQNVKFPVTSAASDDRVWGATNAPPIPNVEHMDDQGVIPVTQLPGITLEEESGGTKGGRRKRIRHH